MGPLESVQRLECAKGGGAGAACEIGPLALAALERNELLDGLRGAQAALVRMHEERGERIAGGAEADGPERVDEIERRLTFHRNPPGRAE